MVNWVKTSRDKLAARPTPIGSLTAAEDTPEALEATQRCIDDFGRRQAGSRRARRQRPEPCSTGLQPLAHRDRRPLAEDRQRSDLGGEMADVAAASIARLAGAQADDQPFHPVIRGTLLTGGKPLYISARLVGQMGFRSPGGAASRR